MPDVDSKYNYVLLDNSYPIKTLRRVEPEWDRKKLAAAKTAVSIVDERLEDFYVDTDDDDESLDSLDAMYDDTKDWRRRNYLNDKRKSISRFCMALPNNLVFTTGFDFVLHEREHEDIVRPVLGNPLHNWCYCPCSRKMSKWQNQFDVQTDSCSNIKKCTPAALIDHCGTHDDIYHKAVLFYLQDLYSDVLDDALPGRKARREACRGIKWEKYVWSTSE